ICVICGLVSVESQQRTSLLKRQPWIPRIDLRGIAIPDVDQEVRLDMPLGEELLIASFALAAGVEEIVIELRVVEARHRPAIEPKATCGDDEIRTLQRRIAPRRPLDQLRSRREG